MAMYSLAPRPSWRSAASIGFRARTTRPPMDLWMRLCPDCARRSPSVTPSTPVPLSAPRLRPAHAVWRAIDGVLAAFEDVRDTYLEALTAATIDQASRPLCAGKRRLTRQQPR